MEQPFELLALTKFLCQALAVTEEVKDILQFHCDEAAFALKPWCIETIIKKEVSGDTCICSKNTPESEVEEIAAGISRALLQTQQLREKISLNIMEDKKHSKYTDASNVYKSKVTTSVRQVKKVTKPLKTVSSSNEERNKVKSSGTNVKKTAHDAMNLMMQKKSSKTSNKTSALLLATKQSAIKTEGRKESTNEKLIVSSKNVESSAVSSHKNSSTGAGVSKLLTKSTVKPTKGKDFLTLNKLNVKHRNQIEKCKNTNEKIKTSKPGTAAAEIRSTDAEKRVSTASTSELKILIEKMSLELNALPSSTERDNCPLHGNVSPQFINEQNFVTMDVVESLDRFNIPGDMIKTLKTFHAYLNSEFSNEPMNSGKRQKVVDKFVTELKEMNDKSTRDQQCETQLSNISTSFISIFRNVFEKDVNSTCLDDTKKAYAEINLTWEIYGGKDFDVTRIKRSGVEKRLFSNTPSASGWMLNGIWNCSYIKNFGGIFDAPCIRYSNKDQLLLYFGRIQEMQEKEYHKDLIDILLKDIIPNVKETFDPTNAAHVRLYKMIYTLYQGLNPRMPILVKTDE